MKLRHTYPLLFLLLLSAFPVFAQDDGKEVGAAESGTPPVPIEEITIVGERNLLNMHHQIEREEENLYSLFNDLNSSDELDIKCRTVTRRLSHIQERVCEPVFLSKSRVESNRNAFSEIRQAWSDDGIDPVLLLNGLDLLESEHELRDKNEPGFDALSEEMLRIATEHPEYLANLQRIAQLKADYEAARKRAFGKDD